MGKEGRRQGAGRGKVGKGKMAFLHLFSPTLTTANQHVA